MRASPTFSMAAAVMALELTRIPNFSPPAPPRASLVTAMVAATTPACSLTAMTLGAPGPPQVSRVASLSRGGQPSATAAVAMSQVRGGLAEVHVVDGVCGVAGGSGARRRRPRRWSGFSRWRRLPWPLLGRLGSRCWRYGKRLMGWRRLRLWWRGRPSSESVLQTRWGRSRGASPGHCWLR